MRSDSDTRFPDYDRAVVVEGELNSGNTTKATLGMYLPWEMFDVDITNGIPESIGILPCYRAVLQAGADTSWMNPVSSGLNTTTDMYLFDANGYINADAADCILGDAFNGYAKSKGWDLSRIDEGIAECDRGGWDKIFFSEYYGEHFIVEATIVPVTAKGDPWPKTGFTFQKLDGQHYTIWLDPSGENGFVDSINGTKNFPTYQITTLDQDGGWNQHTLTGYDITNPNATKQEGVKLTVVKFGGYFWYFADGKFLTSEEISFMDGNSIPGFWSLGMHTIFKDFSCEEINEDRLTEYLNEKSLYIIDASVEGPGGSVTASKKSLASGESYQLSFEIKNGYRLKSVQINGEEWIEEVGQNASKGTYTVENVQGNQSVIVKFEKCNEVTYSGSITNGENAVSGTIVLEGVSDHSAYYVIEATDKKGFEAKIPAGQYTALITATGCKGLEKTIDLSADLTEDIVLTVSDFAATQKVGGKNVKSAMEKFDLTMEHEGKVYGSYALGTHGDTLYFNGSGSDFVVQATMKYTTIFQANGSYQTDLLGGFGFSDGTSENYLWARDNGIVYTADGWQGWTYQMGIFGKSVLMYPNPQTAVLTVAKQGENLYVYLDGRKVFTAKWSDVAPNIDPSSDIAVGLNMWTDKEAELEYSNYSVNFDSDYVASFINSH